MVSWGLGMLRSELSFRKLNNCFWSRKATAVTILRKQSRIWEVVDILLNFSNCFELRSDCDSRSQIDSSPELLVKSDKVVLLHTLLSFLDSIHISKLVIQEQQQHLSDYQKWLLGEGKRDCVLHSWKELSKTVVILSELEDNFGEWLSWKCWCVCCVFSQWEEEWQRYQRQKNPQKKGNNFII